MTDSVSRFSQRVQNYLAYRPRYPAAIIPFLHEKIGLAPAWTVADIGSGTGFLAELFLGYGSTVIGVEPNDEMRQAAEAYLGVYPGFVSQAGRAEATGLPSSSAELVTAGQAFHWFDSVAARAEFLRILRPSGWVVLVWNTRRLESTPFLRAYEEILQTLAVDYTQTNEKNVGDEDVVGFYGGDMVVARFENIQQLDWTHLEGRVLSSSYVPLAGHPNHEEFMARLRQIFDQYQQSGRIAFEYDTRLYYGRLHREAL